MLQEEIARLTGRLKFEVDNRPLAAFEKKLGGVMTMLRELSTLANKKFTVKVALDSRSLRSQIERATKTKISLTNVDISNEALALQAKRVQEYLNKTPINLNNVKVDIGKLVEQKRFVKTLMGQMAIDLPLKLNTSRFEAELRADLKLISDRNSVKIKIDLNNNNLAVKLRRAMIEAQKRMGELKIRVGDPQVRLKVDRQHLIEEIRAALASSEFRVRLNARNQDFLSDRRERTARGSGGRSSSDRGISAIGHFARGALPGLGAAFAFSQMNDINQRVTAATNSLEAVSGGSANFKSNQGFLQNLTNEMGLNFRDVAPQFSSIYQAAAPKIGVAGTQDMFRGIMQYGTVHGLDKEAMKGSMVALSQMFGKGKIQSEEARQQFSERMPNGMAMLAQAAFDTGQTKNNSVAAFGDLMQKGTADPNIILPQLARNMKKASEENQAYQRSLDSTRVAQGRMNKAFEDSVVIFAAGGFDKGMANFFNTLSESMQRSKPLIDALGGAFEQLSKPVNAVIRLIGRLGENWDEISDYFGVSTTALATFATAVGVFLLPFGGFIVALGAAALALDDFLTYLSGGNSIFGKFVAETPGAQEAVDSIGNSFRDIVKLLGELFEKLGPLGDDLKGLTINDVFLAALELVDRTLKNILNTMQLIKALKNGDLGAADNAASDINLLGGKTTYQRIKEAMVGSDEPRQGETPFWSMENWFGGSASALTGAQSRMPTPGAVNSPSSPANETPISIAPGAIQLSVTVPAPEGADPQQFAAQFAPHFETMATDAVRAMLGAARAQQAERQ